MSTPIEQAAWTEVHLRVAYRLVQRDFKRNRVRYEDAAGGLLALARQLDLDGFPQYTLFIRRWAAIVKVGRTTLSKEYQSALSRARLGHTFRRVAFDGYKESRRPDPRVTNRGVVSERVSIEVAEVTGYTVKVEVEHYV